MAGTSRCRRAVRAALAAREIDEDDVLRDLRVPLLVTHGRADTVVLPAMAEHVLATCPTAEASWYDGVGHVPHLEARCGSTRSSRAWRSALRRGGPVLGDVRQRRQAERRGGVPLGHEEVAVLPGREFRRPGAAPS